jgi:hypothetical protein
MVDRLKLPADRVVLIACGTGAFLMTALTVGAADVHAVDAGPAAAAAFVALGLVPYALTALLSAIRPFRRLVVTATRAVAVIYGLFDGVIRYLALYRPQSSTDAVVVFVLPFWWLPILALVTALSAAALWVAARRGGRPAPSRAHAAR